MKHIFHTIRLETKKQFELVDITGLVAAALAECGIRDGMVTVCCPHTTASVKLNQNEPLLIQDIMKSLYRLVPIDASYSHDLFELRQNVAANERSNGHAHVKAFLMGSSEHIGVCQGKPALGPKQSIFFVEFDGGRKREVNLVILGE